MAEILGFPTDLLLTMLAIAAAYLVVIHSPVLFALAIAWRQRKTMKRRILFVGSVMVGSYGFIILGLMAIVLPVEAFSIFVIPTLKSQGYLSHSSVLAAIDLAYKWWWVLLPVSILASAIFTSRYLARRWNRIVEALHG